MAYGIVLVFEGVVADMASRLGAELGEAGLPDPAQVIESELVNYQTA